MKKKNIRKFEIAATAFIIVLTVLVFNYTACAQKTKINPIKINPPRKISGDFETDNFQIFTLVNEERRKRGLNQLLWDDAVADIARNYSERMARENFFGHFDPNGREVLDRAKTARLKHWSRIGENLFSIADLAKFDAFTVKQWMKSPTHRQNIIDPEWTTTGIGIARAPDGEIFITQVFIKR